MKISLRLILVVSFCLATILLMDISDIFVLLSDIKDFVKVIPLWFVCSVLLFYIVKFLTKRNFSEKAKLIYWTTIGTLSLFHWSMIKFDSHPFDGPIDSFSKRDIISKSNKLDSSVEYIYSIDTTEQGVYIWLKSKKQLLRKLTEQEKNGGEMRPDLDKEAIKKLQ